MRAGDLGRMRYRFNQIYSKMRETKRDFNGDTGFGALVGTQPNNRPGFILGDTRLI